MTDVRDVLVDSEEEEEDKEGSDDSDVEEEMEGLDEDNDSALNPTTLCLLSMTTLAPTEKPSLKVFGIPELAYIICSVIQKRDNVSLMQVCRQFFHDVLPFVWEEVDEANALVSLIPGGGIFTYDSELSPYIVMQLPHSLELSRFNIYAPYVKRFTPSALYIDNHEGWEEFLSCVRSIDLLPNLEALYLPVSEHNRYRSGPDKIQADSANWITAFLSSSLRTLTLVPREATHSIQLTHWLDFDLTNSLITAVSQECRHLCSLSVFPAEIRARGSQFWDMFSQQASFSYDSLQIHSSLAHLSNLSSLSISPVILSTEALIAISGLRNLGSLRVLGLEYDRKVYCDDLQIPTSAFPVLKNLELYQLTWGTIVNMCKAKSIVDGLHSMTISYAHQSDISDANETSMSLSDIIPLLAANNSHVTALSVDSYQHPTISPRVLESLKSLSLVSLHLGWSMVLDHKFEALCSFLSCTPLVEKLKLNMDQDPFSPQRLKTIVGILPRLRSIWIPVEWGLITGLTEADFTLSRSRNTNLLHLRSNFYLPDPQQESAERLAR
ncbi:unnamed protein product [Rhizoctonia solani]|uniref:Uncharacterized protein n=1 Tax=Rhizoctonia solani TaxID=456999 RepID=A0A8H2WGT3_9AGAM|nr:unnamed protein product [Rhizoctonia solani]